MSNKYRGRAVACLFLAGLSTCVARRPGPPAPTGLPPIRVLQTPAAVSAKTFVEIARWDWARPLPDGGALFAEQRDRRLIRLDSALTTVTVLLDSTSQTPPGYAMGCLRPFHGDSTLFAVPNSIDLGRVVPVSDEGWRYLVLDASGTPRRAIRFPTSDGLFDCMGVAQGFAADGRLVFQGPHMASDGNGQLVDTVPLMRLGPPTGRLDTLTWIEVAASGVVKTVDTVGRNGRRYIESITPVYRPADAWAVTSDGAVAVIRWRDYRIEWWMPDGTRRTTRQVEWPWRRLAMADKQRIVDSVAPIWARDFAEQTRLMWERKDGDFVMSARPAPPTTIPDLPPPFAGDKQLTRTDDVGNIWVRSLPTTRTPAGTLYDVIDRNGRMIDRVLFDRDRRLLGVAQGQAYLSAGPLGAMRLERVVVRR